MKKRIWTISICLLSLLLSGYFLGRIALDWYFNRNYYYAPNLSGMTVEEVNKVTDKKVIIIEEAGKDFSSLAEGKIFKQEPPANQVIKKGRTIKVWVSLGENYFQVPDFTGKQLFEIRKLLEENRIKVKGVSRVASPLSYNLIVGTNPGPGEYVDLKEGISLLVSGSTANKVETVPDIIGYNLAEATNILKKRSLFVGKVSKVKIQGLEPNIIVEMSVKPNAKVSAGTTINVKVTE